MKRVSQIAAILLFALGGVSCAVEEVIVEPVLTLSVSPSDTIGVSRGEFFEYEIHAKLDDAPAEGVLIDVFSEHQTILIRTIGPTNSEGAVIYRDTVPDFMTAGFNSLEFVAGEGEAMSNVETRYLYLGDSAYSLSIVARGVLPDGTITDEPVVPQQTIHFRSSQPFLPYMFFEVGSADIPMRYERTGNTGFSLSSLKGQDADYVNNRILDVVGMRLKENSQAAITITGANSNTGVELGNIALSQARAMAARNYLVNTWGIEAARVQVQSRNLPELPSDPMTASGAAENRRVEFSSSDARILRPVSIESREASAVGEAIFRFESKIGVELRSAESWRISVRSQNREIASLQSTGIPPTIQLLTIPNGETLIGVPITVNLEVVLTQDRKFMASTQTRVVAKTVDRESLERFMLIPFPFERAEIDQHAMDLLELLGESVNRSAKGVQIVGFADSTETGPQLLSEARANSAAQMLRALSTLPANVSLVGRGVTTPRFNNALPECRMLNRRVEVTVEK
jgi:outer membrane protein OmpA-like peptidoglycan-associated protein